MTLLWKRPCMANWLSFKAIKRMRELKATARQVCDNKLGFARTSSTLKLPRAQGRCISNHCISMVRMSSLGIKVLYIEPGSLWQNGVCQSFNMNLRDEYLSQIELLTSTTLASKHVGGSRTSTNCVREVHCVIQHRRSSRVIVASARCACFTDHHNAITKYLTALF